MDIKQKYAEKIKAAREGNVPGLPFNYWESLEAHAAPMLSAFDKFVEQLPDKRWLDILSTTVHKADISIHVTDQYPKSYRISAHIPNKNHARSVGFEANLDHPVFCVSTTNGGLFPEEVDQYSFDTLEEAFDCFLGVVCQSIVEAEKYWAAYPDADNWEPYSRTFIEHARSGEFRVREETEEQRAYSVRAAELEKKQESQIREYLGVDHGQRGRQLSVRDADIDHKRISIVEYEHQDTTTWFILKDESVLGGQYSTYEDARVAVLNMEQK